MKNYYFLIIALFLFLPTHIWAVTATPTTTEAVVPTKNKQVEDLKERLATKVAQLRQSERRAMYGTVKTTTISTITIETTTKDIKIELTDDIKVFQMLKGKRTTLTIEDVTKNDVVTVFGEWDTAVEVLKAKVIFIQNSIDPMQRVMGVIQETSKTNFTLNVKTKDTQDYVIDFETTTKTNNWSKVAGIEKGGFSKLLPGDTILVVGTAIPKKDKAVSALRILNIGDMSGIKPTSTPKEEGKEATSSTAKASPTSTKKPTATPIP